MAGNTEDTINKVHQTAQPVMVLPVVRTYRHTIHHRIIDVYAKSYVYAQQPIRTQFPNKKSNSFCIPHPVFEIEVELID